MIPLTYVLSAASSNHQDMKLKMKPICVSTELLTLLLMHVLIRKYSWTTDRLYTSMGAALLRGLDGIFPKAAYHQ